MRSAVPAPHASLIAGLAIHCGGWTGHLTQGRRMGWDTACFPRPGRGAVIPPQGMAGWKGVARCVLYHHGFAGPWWCPNPEGASKGWPARHRRTFTPRLFHTESSTATHRRTLTPRLFHTDSSTATRRRTLLSFLFLLTPSHPFPAPPAPWMGLRRAAWTSCARQRVAIIFE